MAKAIQAIPMERFAALRNAYDRAMKQKEKIKEHTEEIVDHAVRTAEIGAVSYAVGAAEGYFGPIAPFGVPMTLGVAVGSHALALIMPESRAAPHLRAAGDASLACFGYKMGHDAGGKWGKKSDEQRAEKKEIPAKTTTSGDRGTAGGLTPEEKAAIES
jgi:hypothetical protein